MNDEITIDVMLSNDIVIISPVSDIEGFTRVGLYVVMSNSLYVAVTSLCEIVKADFWMGGSGRFAKLKLRGEYSNLIMVKMMLDSYD